MLDLVIAAGRVVDGTGAAPRTADVGVADGRIVEVGAIGKTAARRVIDADGALVTPGWIDGHTHYDGQVTWDDVLEGSAANGVTSVVMGNCGVGFAPVRPDAVDTLVGLMEGVENIPGSALHEGMPWGSWNSFPEYLDFLATRKWTLDVGAQLAHGALRYYVMGERAIGDNDATADDLRLMAKLAEEAVRAGAVGFSTSRIMGHKAMSGDQVPGTFAAEEELLQIARGMAAGGGATFQAIPSDPDAEFPRTELAELDAELQMFGRLSRETNLSVVLSTFQINAKPTGYRDVLDRVRVENELGARLSPMVAPKAVSLLMTLQGYHAFMRRPTYLRYASLPLPELVEQLRNEEVKAAILAEGDAPTALAGSMDNIMPALFVQVLPFTYALSDPMDFEPVPESSLCAQAAGQGRESMEFLYDFLLGQGGKAVAVAWLANYVDGNLDACREMLSNPYTVSGLSDAGAHVGLVCDMGNPTFHLTHWVRDRRRGERLPVELIVAKTTGAIARAYGWRDRGTLEVGRRADINVVDLDHLAIHQPEVRFDLPGGGKRLLQLATGYVHTLVNGVETRNHDCDTGERPGRLIRGHYNG